MYYFNMLEPQLVCDKAIKTLNREKLRLESEIHDYNWTPEKQSLEGDMENYQKALLLKDYMQLIEQLKDLSEFSMEQMAEIVKKGERKGRCIL